MKFCFQSRRIIIPPDDLKIIMNKTLDTEFKGGLMITLSQVLYKNQVHQQSFQYQVCKEFYSMVPVTMYFPKYHYLVETINRKLELFSAAGLIGFWASFHMDMKYLNFKWTHSGPKKINMNHLSGIFQIWLFGLGISFLSLVLEVFWQQIKQLKNVKQVQTKKPGGFLY